ncbi:hypothetical protein HKD37_02G003195 [Glycine soja]
MIRPLMISPHVFLSAPNNLHLDFHTFANPISLPLLITFPIPLQLAKSNSSYSSWNASQTLGSNFIRSRKNHWSVDSIPATTPSKPKSIVFVASPTSSPPASSPNAAIATPPVSSPTIASPPSKVVALAPTTTPLVATPPVATPPTTTPPAVTLVSSPPASILVSSPPTPVPVSFSLALTPTTLTPVVAPSVEVLAPKSKKKTKKSKKRTAPAPLPALLGPPAPSVGAPGSSQDASSPTKKGVREKTKGPMIRCERRKIILVHTIKNMDISNVKSDDGPRVRDTIDRINYS